mmetsp:Transcript_131841/g.328742  ORF Transcript_131841/g.328742 Transcript_131841/m.328742 type:complete len:202 (+) Transcript_131841:2273-2878(+)
MLQALLLVEAKILQQQAVIWLLARDWGACREQHTHSDTLREHVSFAPRPVQNDELSIVGRAVDHMQTGRSHMHLHSVIRHLLGALQDGKVAKLAGDHGSAHVRADLDSGRANQGMVVGPVAEDAGLTGAGRVAVHGSLGQVQVHRRLPLTSANEVRTLPALLLAEGPTLRRERPSEGGRLWSVKRAVLRAGERMVLSSHFT